LHLLILGKIDFAPETRFVRTQIELSSALRKGRRMEAANQLLRGGAPNLIAAALLRLPR